MILISCTIKCDRNGCEAIAEARLQFMGTNVPSYCNQWQMANPPEGWDIQNTITGDVLRLHFCPAHLPKSKTSEPFAFSNISGSETTSSIVGESSSHQKSSRPPEKYEDVYGVSEQYDRDGFVYPDGNYPQLWRNK